jgi:hypothetical protein
MTDADEGLPVLRTRGLRKDYGKEESLTRALRRR